MTKILSHRNHNVCPSSTRIIAKKIASSIVGNKCYDFDSFTSKNGMISTLNEAYSIQNEVSEILQNNFNLKRVGYQICGTTAQFQSTYGLSTPVYSPFHNYYSCDWIAEQETKGLSNICIQSVLVFSIRESLNISDKKEINENDIQNVIYDIFPGFIFVKPRIIDNINLNCAKYLISDLCGFHSVLLDQIAGSFMFGDWSEYEEIENQNKIHIYIDNELQTIGSFNNSFKSLKWLYNTLLLQNKTIQKNELILVPTSTQNITLKPQQKILAEYGRFGYLEMTLRDSNWIDPLS